MIAILKLRWMKLRDDSKLMLFMTGLTLIMIAVFASIGYEPTETKIGLVDEDQSPITIRLYDVLNHLEGYEIILYDLESAKEAVKEDDIEGAFYIEKGFTTQLQTGSAQIQRLLISENMDNMQMVNLIDSSLKKVLSEYQFSQVLLNNLDLNQLDGNAVLKNILATLDEHWTYKQPVTLTAKTLTEEKNYDAIKHSVIGFSLFFAMFTIVFGISDILVEKEQNTWQRQLISPISKFSMITGNMLGVFVLGFVQVSAMFILSKYLFKVQWEGSMLVLLIVVAAFVFCVASMGMMLSNFVSTMGQLSAISPVILTGTAMLGGCFWPLEIVTSKVLLFLSILTPQRWAIEAIEKLLIHGYNISAITNNIIILFGMGMVYLLLGTLLLNRKALA
ncbi:MAG: ABC transporter permease [Clostridia bacterium]|nr:ABC transporter permease [Clostridia bacterium]